MKYTLVHEITDSRHRILCLNEDGSNDVGDWVSCTEIATHKVRKQAHFAICGESVLPQGIFTVQARNHQVLT